jgi:hypothetical protein
MYVRAVRAHLEEREHSGTANLHPTGPGVRERTAAEHRVRSRRQVLGCRPDKLVLQHRPQLFRGGQHIFKWQANRPSGRKLGGGGNASLGREEVDQCIAVVPARHANKKMAVLVVAA